ncbi:DUF6790 family protein [Clostridium chromiireducens]|uniref:DUF6790 family protein n=1 Tax=Clostridium chromiireducens TaxID=225345 RepID=UPI003AF5C717
MKRKIGMFEVSVILFFYILPTISIIINLMIRGDKFIVETIVKWVVFWGIGLRFFTCGLKQALQPRFTANDIFGSYDEKAYPIVRELGFANICTGLCGIVSLFNEKFRMAAIIIGGLYYLLALFQHLFRKQKNSTEVFVTITDLSIFLEICVPTLYILIFK